MAPDPLRERIRAELILLRLRRVDRLIVEGRGREARRTFAAIGRDVDRWRLT